jgi:APA family basic amino acid/polyamine antiporter
VSSSSSSPARLLERRLGPFDAAAIVIANVIGVGIFITPGFIAQSVPHATWILGVWVAGGLLAFAGAMAYAELAAMRPRSGGEYVYLREAFGPLAAFLTGWTSFVAGFAGAVAAGALGVAQYLGRFIPAAGDPTPLVSLSVLGRQVVALPFGWTFPLGPLGIVISRQTIVALSAIAALAIVHIRGLGPGRVVQNTLATLKVAALTTFVALGLGFGRGHAANFASTAVGAPNFALAMLLVMFTYSGWNAASYVAEEIRNPGRNVPFALALGTGVVVLLYLGLNLLYLYAVPVAEITQFAASGQTTVANLAADRLLGSTASILLGGLAVVILLSSLSAMTLAGPRVYYAMARDGVFFRAAATVHPRFHTPWVSMTAQAVWSGILVLIYSSVDLAEYTGFAVLLFSGFAVSALFVLRRRSPHEPRPFRAWGYPVAPAMFTIASLVITVFAIVGRPRQSLFGLFLMAAGIPLYLWTRRHREARDSASQEAPRA